MGGKSGIIGRMVNENEDIGINSVKAHLPVLEGEVVELLTAARGGVFFDGTVGLGGHSRAILAANGNNYVYGTDRDGESLAIAQERLAPFSGRFSLFQADFKQIESLPIAVPRIDGFLFDLGVSSFQLDSPHKGFSYARPAPLDMRMDSRQPLTARQVVNHYSYDALFAVFKEYGELKNPARLCQQIVFHRKQRAIETTADLKEIVRRILPRRPTMDPLARVFQAIRIEVNRELTGLKPFFQRLIDAMKPGARIVSIAFHSLEDRIAKSVLKTAREGGLIKLLIPKPLTAGDQELSTNPRARSARLRAAEKIC